MDPKELIHNPQCCSRVDAFGCDDCTLEYCGPECEKLCGTAAAALTELEAKYELLARYAAEKYTQCEALEKENAQLQAELEQVKRERDAAEKDLRGYCWCCVHGSKYVKAPIWSNATTCKYMKERGVAAIGGGRGGKNCPHWQWRGPMKEE